MQVTPERWQQVVRIYELTLEKDPSERDAFLSGACADDAALRSEVESLLSQDGSSMMLDRSVWAIAAPLFEGGASLQPGDALGPYRIESLLGAGGMGQVFSAVDTRLNRRVAVKVLGQEGALDQAMRARFGREARAVAALRHPHICTLFDVGRHNGVDFLVMEYLEGETLAVRLAKGPLSTDEVVGHAMAIASALDHAHRHGIVHRDLKPGNVLLTSGGPKLVDFGLAKFPHSPADDLTDTDITPALDRADEGQLTRVGAVLGTIRYMAPEQVTGLAVDARTDVFAFGALLYEMITGRRAFDGDTVAAIRRSILEGEPPSAVSMQASPPAIGAIVRRCLARDPRERWSSAAEVLREFARTRESTRLSRRSILGVAAGALLALTIAGLLAGLWRDQSQQPAPPVNQIRSIAVLPLQDLSGDAGHEYFADAMTDQLIGDLAKIRQLRVTSRTSVMGYRNVRKPAPVVARELHVDALIEGSIVRANDVVRIAVKLIDGASGAVIWSQDFERDMRSVLTLQREVARTITSRVDITLTPQEQAQLGNAQPVDPEIHRLVLLGRYQAAGATEQGLRKAIDVFKTAIAMDGANAMAHAGLAEALMGLSGYYVHPRQIMPNAKRAAETALALDQSLAEAHAALGFIHLVYDWDGPATEQSLRRALELNPTLATARLHYAAYLTTQARHDEAVDEIRRAVESDPVSIRTNSLATNLLVFARRYEEAIELARRGLEFEPNAAFTLAFQGIAYAELGRFAAAVDNLRRAASLDASPTILSLQAHVLAVAGQKQQAAALIRKLEEMTKDKYFCPYEIGAAHVSMGDIDTAYRWFRKGVEERADCMAWLGVEPWIESFRSDPRYATLVREIGLDPSAR